MNGILSLLALVFFFFQQIIEVRKRLISTDTGRFLVFAPSTDEGICKLLVESRGYVYEEHKETTKDGNIPSLQRIPIGLTNYTARGSSPPVLLQHGVLMDGITWLLNPPDQSLAFILAYNNFDVWVANSRGTKYSLGHMTLSSTDSAYWDWSWDELMAYDLPAMIQYVYDHSGKHKLHYVGHSQGTLIALTAFSHQKFNMDMVKSASLLCPIAYLSRMTSTLAKDAAESFLMYWSGLHEFVPHGNHWVLLVLCLAKREFYIFDSMRQKTLSGQSKLAWHLGQCPQQLGGCECGYYLMRMFEILQYHHNSEDLIMDFSRSTTYIEVEINEVRDIWADYFI